MAPASAPYSESNLYQIDNPGAGHLYDQVPRPQPKELTPELVQKGQNRPILCKLMHLKYVHGEWTGFEAWCRTCNNRKQSALCICPACCKQERWIYGFQVMRPYTPC